MSDIRTVAGTLEDVMAFAARLIDGGDLAAADDICRQLQAQFPNVGDIAFYRAVIAVKRYEYRAAIEHLDTAIRLGGTTAKHHELRLKAYASLGMLEEAERYYWQHRRAIVDSESLKVKDAVLAALEARAVAGRRRGADGRFDLGDVTFVIPIYVETADRARNLSIVLRFLAKHFATKILVCEDVKDGAPKAPERLDGLDYRRLIVTENDGPYFHKTWMINHALAASTTEINVVYDSDVVVHPVQCALAHARIAEGANAVFAYNGTVIDVAEAHIAPFAESLDIATLDPLAEGNTVPGIAAHGGALFLTRRAIAESGGFNENIIGWGLEDREMVERLVKLGIIVERIEGALFHLRHQRTANSNETHPFWETNRRELEAMRAMSRAQLVEAVAAGRFRHALAGRRERP